MLELFFSAPYRHEHLVKKSFGLLKFLMNQGELEPAEFGNCWDSCQGDAATATEMTRVCGLLVSGGVPAQYQTTMIEKLTGREGVHSRELELMLKMARRSSATREIQAKVVDFFWTYLFGADGASASEAPGQAPRANPDEGNATRAIEALKELLLLVKEDAIIDIFSRLVNKIKTNRQGYFVVAIASKFIQAFVRKGNVKCDELLHSFQVEQ